MKYVRCTIVFIIIGLLAISLDATAKNNVIQWENSHLESILGDELSETIINSFTSTKELTDIELWIVPELQPYVTVEPKSFDHIEPGVPYEVTITTSIPVGALPEVFDGTIHLKKGKKSIPEILKLSLEIIYENAVPYPTTKYLHDRTSSNIDCELSEENLLVFTSLTDELNSLEPNDVIIIGSTECTPYGFIGFVDEINVLNGFVYIYTHPASLEDAFEELIIDLELTFNQEAIASSIAGQKGIALSKPILVGGGQDFEPISFDIEKVLYDADGNYNTTDDQVVATGDFSLESSVYFKYVLVLFGKDYMIFDCKMKEDARLRIDADSGLSFEKKYELFSIEAPLPTPIPITAELTIFVGADGSVTASVGAEVNQGVEIEAGVEYDYGNWNLISSFNPTFDYDLSLPDSISCNLKGYVEPQFALLIAGSAGPTASVEGSLELDAEVNNNNLTWDLYAGLAANAGIKGEIFGIQLFNKNFTIFEETWLLASESNVNTGDILIINPDHHRILKHGVKLRRVPGLGEEDCSVYTYMSIASGQVLDNCQDFECWTGVGGEPDFMGSILVNAGYSVQYMEASEMPSIDASDYAMVIVQDPLRTNLLEFDPEEAEYGDPDLLEYVNSPTFVSRLKSYINDGGNAIFVGDAVKMLERDFGKSVIGQKTNNSVSVNSCKIPSKWLFTRGNPFCGRDRFSSGVYTVNSSSLIQNGSVFSELSLKNLNDLAFAETWSETVYHPSDGTSLLDVNVSGNGQYVLDGSVCNPPVYSVSVNDTLRHIMGYTTYNGQRVYYIGSDTFFDYTYRNHIGAWHASQYSEITHTVSATGRNAAVKFVESILD